MLSKVDLRDFFEINQGLYDEPVAAGQMALIQALTQAMDQAAAKGRAGNARELNAKAR